MALLRLKKQILMCENNKFDLGVFPSMVCALIGTALFFYLGWTLFFRTIPPLDSEENRSLITQYTVIGVLSFSVSAFSFYVFLSILFDRIRKRFSRELGEKCKKPAKEKK